jgi:PEP-CTERM motif
MASLLLASLLAAQVATAGPITYFVDRTVGSGTIVGSVQTDGTIGSLTANNILDWNLTINADANAATFGVLLGPSSGGNSTFRFFTTNALAATAGGLLTFDFNGTPGVFQLGTADAAVVWQMQAGIPFRDELIRESLVAGANPTQQFEVRGAVVQTLGAARAVPEPGTLTLLGCGLLGLALSSKTKTRRFAR